MLRKICVGSLHSFPYCSDEGSGKTGSKAVSIFDGFLSKAQ